MLIFNSLLLNFLHLFCFVMTETVSSHMVELYITNDALEASPISNIVPKYEQTLTNGTIFYWEPFNDSLPYLHWYFNHLSYRIYSDYFSDGPSCDICICTHENECYRALDNNNFGIDFIPYCFDNECYMYGIVRSYPFSMRKTFVNELNQTYNVPLPYLTNLGPQSEYLKVVSVSCDGCVRVEKQLNQIMTIYNGTSGPIAECDTTTNDSEMIFYLLFTPSSLIVPYVIILYVIYSLNQAASIFEAWTMFLLALSRWDILGGLNLFPSLDRSKFFKVAMLLVILDFLLHIIVGLIPGFRMFLFFVPSSFCSSPGSDLAFEVNTIFYYNVINYYETELALGLSFLLYIWCTISIFYQLCKYNQSSKKEVLLFIQCLIPCVFLLLINFFVFTISTMGITSDSTLGWIYIVIDVFLQFESVHHPIIYLSLNKSLRKEFKIYMKKLFDKIYRKGLSPNQLTATTPPVRLFVTVTRI